MKSTPRSVLLSLCLLACASSRPSSPPARAADVAPGPSSTAASAPAVAASQPDPALDAVVDRNLMAILGQGTALPDHIGPDAAREVYAHLDQNPTRYLARLDARFAALAPSAADTSLFYDVLLWRLRDRDPAGTARLAMRARSRLQTLSAQTAPADDAGYRSRLARRLRGVRIILSGVDVEAGPRWRRVDADAVCVTAAPDGRAVYFVTRSCTCGEPLSCRATVSASRVDIDLRLNPEAPGVCTDCYPGYAACTAPTLPPDAPSQFAPCADDAQ